MATARCEEKEFALNPGFHDGALTGCLGLDHLEDIARRMGDAVFRGFAESFWGWLTSSAAEFGYTVESSRDSGMLGKG